MGQLAQVRVRRSRRELEWAPLIQPASPSLKGAPAAGMGPSGHCTGEGMERECVSGWWGSNCSAGGPCPSGAIFVGGSVRWCGAGSTYQTGLGMVGGTPGPPA